MTAAEVKTALRSRHPGLGQFGGPGPWTCLEEYRGIDLLAFCAWSSWPGVQGRHPIVGYEVKVSRSDLRAELLRPYKRQPGIRLCNEFYLACPKGLIRLDELAYTEPVWEPEDFVREPCPARCHRPTRRALRLVEGEESGIDSKASGRYVRREGGELGWGTVWEPCEACGGKGYLARSRVEREAPTCWVPADVGLVTVSQAGQTRVVKRSPSRQPEALPQRAVAQLVRWASYRPDPRHTSVQTKIPLSGGADDGGSADTEGVPHERSAPLIP